MTLMISGSKDMRLDDLTDVSGFTAIRDLNVYGLERRTAGGVYGPALPPPGPEGPTGPEGPRARGSFYLSHKGQFVSPITVTGPTDITTLLGELTATNIDSLLFYDFQNQVFRAVGDTEFFYPFLTTLRLSGTYTGNQTSELGVELRRADGVTIITSSQYVRVSNGPLVDVTAAIIPTRVFPGGNDPFQSEGFRIFLTKISGADFTFSVTDFQEIS